MNVTLLKSWWMLALRGAIAIAFGLLAILLPRVTLVGLITLFAAYALLSGAVWICGAARHRKADEQWWVLLMLGMVSIGAGIIAALHPGLTSLVLILLMGANALVTGVLDVVVAVRLRRFIRGEVLLVLTGMASILFGVIVFMAPASGGALALVWLISLYALITGGLMLGAALRVRAWTRVNTARSSPASA